MDLEYKIKTIADVQALEKYKAALQGALKHPQADAAKLTADLKHVEAALGSSAAQTHKLKDAMAKVGAARPGGGGLKELSAGLQSVTSQIPVVGTMLGTIAGAAATPLAAVGAAISAIAFGLREVSNEQNIVARLKGFGFDAGALDQHVAAIKNLARVTGGDWAGATEIYLRAAAGQTRALAALGITIDETATRSERLASIQAQLAARALRVAAAEAGTFTGEIKQMWKALGDTAQAMVQYTGIAFGFGLLLKGLNVGLEGLRRGAMAFDQLRQGNVTAAISILKTGEAMTTTTTASNTLKASLDEQIESYKKLGTQIDTYLGQQLDLIDIEQQLADQSIDTRVAKGGDITAEEGAVLKGQSSARAATRKQEEKEKAAGKKVTLAEASVYDQEEALKRLRKDLPDKNKEPALYTGAINEIKDKQKALESSRVDLEKARIDQNTLQRRRPLAEGGQTLADIQTDKQFLNGLYENATPEGKQRLLKPAARQQSEDTFAALIAAGKDRTGNLKVQLDRMLAVDEEELRVLEDLDGRTRRVEAGLKTIRTQAGNGRTK